LVAVIIRVQDRTAYGEVFFFKSKKSEQHYPWERVVDTNTPLVFEVETDFPKKSWNSLIAADIAVSCFV
jgi:hypothetical protein